MSVFVSATRSWRRGLLSCLWAVAALLGPESAFAALPIMPGSPATGFCDRAIDAAERRNATPPQLLAAMGQVESGRRDPTSGRWHPWPWTANAEGQGYFYDTKADAVAAVRAMQGRGLRSIDIGCMQVNLLYHPDAFASLEAAFDPQANALYAARFLRELFARTSDWPKAVALYHSATPQLAADYQLKVMTIWPGQNKSAGSPLARAWAATLGATSPGVGHGVAYGLRVPVERPPPLPTERRHYADRSLGR
jgi:hypothetical protein